MILGVFCGDSFLNVDNLFKKDGNKTMTYPHYPQERYILYRGG